MGRSDDMAYTYGDTVDANCVFEVKPTKKLAVISIFRDERIVRFN
jgi:hypothetical protein